MSQHNTVINGDCLTVMQKMDDNSIDAIVTDPPYGLSFMNKDWDHGIPGTPFWQEMLRIAKPGSHLLAFGGTRTHHRLMVAIEDAGWEIRDCMMWLYGSGFPKSLDVSKAIDKMQGATREPGNPGPYASRRPNESDNQVYSPGVGSPRSALITVPITDDAKQWDGWGTALKPAWEPIIMARKPLDGTVAENVLKWGTGGINIDGCRIEMQQGDQKGEFGPHKVGLGESNPVTVYNGGYKRQEHDQTKGRFPTNLILDEEAGALLDEQSGKLNGTKPIIRPDGFERFNGILYARGKKYKTKPYISPGYSDTGGASRFFYTAKATSGERNKYLRGLPSTITSDGRDKPIDNPYQRGETLRKNHHPTVKPVNLLRYLCKLITPPGGVVLDPFAGSGSTGLAAFEEGFDYILIEIDPEYCGLAKMRNAQKRIAEFA